MAKRFAFRITWQDNDQNTLYALNQDHAEKELDKLTYSMAPIRFLKLYAKTGESVFVNLGYVATVVYVEDEQP